MLLFQRIFLFFKNFFHRALLSICLVLYSVRYGKLSVRAIVETGRGKKRGKEKLKKNRKNKRPKLFILFLKVRPGRLSILFFRGGYLFFASFFAPALLLAPSSGGVVQVRGSCGGKKFSSARQLLAPPPMRPV